MTLIIIDRVEVNDIFLDAVGSFRTIIQKKIRAFAPIILKCLYLKKSN